MTITVNQRWEGSAVSLAEEGNATVSSEFIIEGTGADAGLSEFTALASLVAGTAVLVGGLVRKSAKIDGRLASNVWAGSVEWGKFEPKEDGDSSFAFDTGGGSTQTQHSISTISSTSATGDPAPDYAGGINVTDSSVEGTSITVPQYTFQETHYLAFATVSAAYKLTLFALTGTTNNATFKGLAAGECLFLGASGSLKKHDQWEITYKFSASPNATNVVVGPSITVPSKDGWQYLWVRYRDEEDAASKTLARKPLAAYVEQVYPEANHGLLGI